MALNEQQKYLLERIPKKYDIKFKNDPEPANIVAARKTIAAWDEKQKVKLNAFNINVQKMVESAREAVHFKTLKDALEIIKTIEDLR
jgi:hypothetical protein